MPCTGVKEDTDLDWVYNEDAKYDLRYILVKCSEDGSRWEPAVNWGTCHGLNEKSFVFDDVNICYSTEAIKYA